MTDRLVQRILRVNHAGEHGAVGIYSRQLERAQRRYPDLVPWLSEVLGHEVRHRAAFSEAMPSRSAKPCRLMSVWTYGGAALGWLTALFGRTGVYACTAAVERTVHRHLVEQIAFLERRDPELAAIISDILAEEDEHLEHAETNLGRAGPVGSLLDRAVAVATELLIFVSTRGDSLRLKDALRQPS